MKRLENNSCSREACQPTSRASPGEGLALEDLLATLADTVWKGKRDEPLEQEVCRRMAAACGQAPWEVFLALDEVLERLARDADERLE